MIRSAALGAAGAEAREGREALSPRERIGVNVFDATQLPPGWERLPIGWYKDFSALGPVLSDARAAKGRLDYVPILGWRSSLDRFLQRLLLAGLYLKGDIPRAGAPTLDGFRDLISLARLEARIERDAARLPPETLFLMGIEPGYVPNGDDRSAAEIVADSRAVRAMLDRLGRGYRLGLGGISTPRNEWTHTGYGGRYGIELFEEVLALADPDLFDAFVVHPYPSDLARPDPEDSAGQIREFRAVLARHGLRERELIVGEVGVPFTASLPEDRAPYTESIVEFMLTARDTEIGNPVDDDRLVQRFAWFLLAPLTAEVPGFSDNPALDFEASALLTPEGRTTAVGEAFLRAVERAAGG